jgi:hypothetical protein
VVVEVASILEDVEASTVNIASFYIMKKDELSAKRLRPTPLTQVISVPSSNVSTFEFLSKLKGMALIPPPIWPKCYDDIVAFLTKVLIPISKSLICHFPYSICIHTCQIFITFPSNSTLSCIYNFLKAEIFIFKVNFRRSMCGPHYCRIS